MTANAGATFPAPATGTPPRSCGRIFTCGEAQIATSPFVYRSMGILMPEKLGNLQGRKRGVGGESGAVGGWARMKERSEGWGEWARLRGRVWVCAVDFDS